MSGSPISLSVVIPCRNEAGNVGPLVAELHQVLAGRGTYEIIVVDDASTDATGQELATLADPRVRVLTHQHRCGQSQATVTGALSANGVWIATLDGDGQNDPADLPKFLDARDRAGATAARTLFIGRREKRQDGALRLLASRLANAIRRGLLGDGTADSACGMKLIARDLLLELPRFNALHRFMPALVLRAGGRVVSIPIGQRPRTRGQSKYTITGRGLIGIVDLLGIVWLKRRHTQPQLTSQEKP